MPSTGTVRHSPVHPHLRGEHRVATSASAFQAGSSPPAWRTRRDGERDEGGHRFIPTCVGNTAHVSIDDRALTVHPHLRGEHCRMRRRAVRKSGSSPPAWGTRLFRRSRPQDRRFIPTRVGNTRLPKFAPSECTVHPHPRGEHIAIEQGRNCIAGSSPPAWGTHEPA